MRMIMMGTGAVGGVIGGRLARYGNDIVFVDSNAEHIQAIRRQGLTVDVPDGPFNISVPIFFPDEMQGEFDLAFIAVKSYATAQALSSLKSHLNQNAILVSLQNGVNPPLLEGLVGPDHAVGTLIRMSCRCLESGNVRALVRGLLSIGHLHGRTTPQLVSVHEILNAVIPTEMTHNILGALWSKLTYTCLRMFESLTGVTLKEIWQTAINREVCVDFMAELVAVGSASGVDFEPLKEYNPLDFHPHLPRPVRLVTFTKMAQDWKSGGPVWAKDDPGGTVNQLKQGLKSEVDNTVGHVLREGERLGIQTPICRTLVELIHEIELGRRPLHIDNFALLTTLLS